MGARKFFFFAVPALGAALGLACCVNETHELAVQALGGEAPGVSRGPLHRPGQPCLVCHGVDGPASKRFVVAGTIYAEQGTTNPAPGAQAVIEDINGSVFAATANEAGNFYVTPDEWAPTFPAQVQVVQGANNQPMLTHIGRDGSCADCHTQSPGPDSAGPVYTIAAPLPEGGP
jgi:hypothetical protein